MVYELLLNFKAEETEADIKASHMEGTAQLEPYPGEIGSPTIKERAADAAHLKCPSKCSGSRHSHFCSSCKAC